jgi:hypothetical protein
MDQACSSGMEARRPFEQVIAFSADLARRPRDLRHETDRMAATSTAPGACEGCKERCPYRIFVPTAPRKQPSLRGS